ncbi:YadA family autotransporter adhesin [Pseudomonas sp. CGJS7]|uniref:YadA family autotransporter adhesin n=1 Tax=Pseudomonas sp. CGJS7 TaxID=3109348 RepID=UPI003008C63D
MKTMYRAFGAEGRLCANDRSDAEPSRTHWSALAVSLASLLMIGQASAADPGASCAMAAGSSGGPAHSQDDGAFACGSSASANYGSAAAFGTRANANATTSTALGTDTIVNGVGGTAVGNQANVAQAAGEGTAIGVSSSAAAFVGTAVGGRSSVSGNGGTAVGHSANVSGSYGTAIGNSAVANGDRSLALGVAAKSSHANSVAIGADTATTVGAQAGYNAAYVGTSDSTGQVNVGGRTIGSVAAGVANDDAVNVSQLRFGVNYAIDQSKQYTDGRVSYAIDESKKYTDGRVTYAIDESKKYTDSRVGEVSNSVTNIINGSTGVFQVSQDDTAPASATGAGSTAGGAGSVASGDRSTALGNDASATGTNSVAIGAGSIADQPNTVSVGSVGNERRIVNVADGVAGTDGANMNQLNQVRDGGVRYDKNPDGTTSYERITLNPNGGGSTIHNVRAGVAPTDAVNVKQLNDGMAKTLTQANDYTDKRIGDVRSDLNNVNRDARGGTAAAMAMAGLPQAYLPGRSMAAIAGSSYQGESGLAVGVSTISENGRYVYKMQGSGNTTGDWGVTVGAGLQW